MNDLWKRTGEKKITESYARENKKIKYNLLHFFILLLCIQGGFIYFFFSHPDFYGKKFVPMLFYLIFASQKKHSKLNLKKFVKIHEMNLTGQHQYSLLSYSHSIANLTISTSCIIIRITFTRWIIKSWNRTQQFLFSFSRYFSCVFCLCSALFIVVAGFFSSTTI